MCISPIKIRHPTKKGEFLTVPCGKCLECKNKKVNEWAFRLKAQMMESCSTYFFTLTYDDDSLPLKGIDKKNSKTWFNIRRHEWFELPNFQERDNDFEDYVELCGHELLDIEVLPCFRKSDVQEFVHRIRDKIRYQLRKKYSAKQVNEMMKPIKYFVSSEYGSKTNRPHYHGIFFGLPVKLDDFVALLQECWFYGFVSASACNEARCYYCAKYALKNATVLHKDNFDKGFILVSKGLGACFLDSSTRKYMLGDGKKEVKIFIHQNGRNCLIPKYYRDKVFHNSYLKQKLKVVWDNFDELAGAPESENPFCWRSAVYENKVRKAKQKSKNDKL